MSRHMGDIREMLSEELDKVAQNGELTAGSLDAVDKLTHAIKSIDTIMAMGGHSNDYRPSYRYSRGYSYAKNSIIDQLERVMESAQDEESRRVIRRAIEKLEK